MDLPDAEAGGEGEGGFLRVAREDDAPFDAEAESSAMAEAESPLASSPM